MGISQGSSRLPEPKEETEGLPLGAPERSSCLSESLIKDESSGFVALTLTSMRHLLFAIHYLELGGAELSLIGFLRETEGLHVENKV